MYVCLLRPPVRRGPADTSLHRFSNRSWSVKHLLGERCPRCEPSYLCAALEVMMARPPSYQAPYLTARTVLPSKGPGRLLAGLSSFDLHRSPFRALTITNPRLLPWKVTSRSILMTIPTYWSRGHPSIKSLLPRFYVVFCDGTQKARKLTPSLLIEVI